jgi:hypothetical protein
VLGIALLQFAKESTLELLYSQTIALYGSIAIQERIKFARCKPRICFARKRAIIARINCKALIARSTAILQLMT